MGPDCQRIARAWAVLMHGLRGFRRWDVVLAGDPDAWPPWASSGSAPLVWSEDIGGC